MLKLILMQLIILGLFIRTIFFEKNIKTNIYNLNGIYVNNYDCKEEQGVFRVEILDNLSTY